MHHGECHQTRLFIIIVVVLASCNGSILELTTIYFILQSDFEISSEVRKRIYRGDPRKMTNELITSLFTDQEMCNCTVATGDKALPGQKVSAIICEYRVIPGLFRSHFYLFPNILLCLVRTSHMLSKYLSNQNVIFGRMNFVVPDTI